MQGEGKGVGGRWMHTLCTASIAESNWEVGYDGSPPILIEISILNCNFKSTAYRF